MLIEAFPSPARQPSEAMDGIGQGRERLLKRLNELLASSFDYEATIRQICWLAVPDLADWCAVYLLDHDGNATRVSVAHADRADATLARALENADPPRSGELPGVLKILENGPSRRLYTCRRSRARVARPRPDAPAVVAAHGH